MHISKLEKDVALVLFSGGQDSAVCLAWALSRYKLVETLGFNYGQRHHIELNCREYFLSEILKINPRWRKNLGKDHLLDFRLLKSFGNSAMTHDISIVIPEDGSVPNTFVPGRNLMFITAAATLAYWRNMRVIVGGMCETDSYDYPDCRNDTIKSLQKTINLGMDTNFIIETPLMQLRKSQVWALAEEIGGASLVEAVRIYTHTCYLGDRKDLHDWGYGCSTCPSCILRAVGYREYTSSSTKKI